LADASSQSTADLRTDGAHVDPDFAVAQSGDDSVLTISDFPERGGIGDHGKREVGRGGDGAGRVGPFHSAIDEPLGFGARTVVASDRVALIEQTVDHAATHDAQTDESQICHSFQFTKWDATLYCPFRVAVNRFVSREAL